MSVKTGCEPREEVLRGDLDDAIFAADFGNLINGAAPLVYRDAKLFFQSTYPTKNLCQIVQAVFRRLADTKENGAAISLSTGFGGGKTHALITLWHLAHHIHDPALGTELLPAAGRPGRVKVVAVDVGKAGTGEEFRAHGDVRVHSLWGDLFYQLGGATGLERLGKADDPEASPSDQQLKDVFPTDTPVLILLDEAVTYLAALSEQGQMNFLKFIKMLSEEVTSRPQAVLLMTDPGSQQAYQTQSDRLRRTMIATRLEDVYGRKASDLDPIGDEAAQVITRRLFERIDPVAAETASASYHSLYKRVAEERPTDLPKAAATEKYAKQIRQCYPFHPRLFETAQDRLGAIQEFNKSRGTLRLFSRLLRVVWEMDSPPDLICAGDVDWSNPSLQGDLLQRLSRDHFKAAVSTDVEKHAGELDGDQPRGIHRRVASALLLESIPLQQRSGLDQAEATLAVLRPEEAGDEPAAALERLVGLCWHTYPIITESQARGWQFRYEPNILKLIEERTEKIDAHEAQSRVMSEVQQYFGGLTFKLAAWPTSAKQVPNSADLQLVLCSDEALAERICAYEDDTTNPDHPFPRPFRNAIIAVTAKTAAFDGITQQARRLLAAEAIEREYRGGESGKLVRDQLNTIMPGLRTQFSRQARRAFDRVVLASGSVGTLEEAFQVPDDDSKALQQPRGQENLRRFLEEKGLMFRDSDTLDPHKLLTDVLPGATPLPGQSGVWTAKAVHERLLGVAGLRLLSSKKTVQQTVFRALNEGHLAVCFAEDGRAYDAQGVIRTVGEQRLRGAETLNAGMLKLEDSVWIARADSDAAKRWLTEKTAPAASVGDGRVIDPYIPPPPPPQQVRATSWEQVRDAVAEGRPLRSLKLIAKTPTAAHLLLTLAQPFGAATAQLGVTVSGNAKEGGTINFKATDLKPNHAIQPLKLGQTLFNALADGRQFEAVLALALTSAQADWGEALLQAADQAPAEVQPVAQFDSPESAL